MSLTTIVPLQMVIYKEDGPPDDQNQGDGGARIVANDHPYDPASSVLLLLRSFANGLLQRGRFSGWPKSRGRRRWRCCKWSSRGSSVPLQMVFCKEDCASDDQNQRDGGARVVVNNHLDDPASSVLLRSFANGGLQRERSSGGPTFFWSDGRMKFAPDLSLV